MRSHNGLWERLVSFENLYRAFRQAARGKSERLYCARFSYHRERELLELKRELEDGSLYVISDFGNF